MEFSPVLTKQDFVRRFLANEFGNRGPTWDTWREFADSEPSDRLYHLRNRIAGGPTYYNLTWKEVWGLWITRPNVGNWYVAEMAPTDCTLIQGEVQYPVPGTGKCGLDLYYSTVAKPMRDSLKEGGRQVSGIVAVELLRYYLDPASLEWLYTLLERYPGHVVEFSTYSVNWGTIPNRNTTVWEVRKY